MVKLFSNVENRFVHFPQRLAHGTVFGLIAGSVFGEAVSQNHRAINGPHHFERRNSARMPGQFIAAVGACHRLHNACPRQVVA